MAARSTVFKTNKSQAVRIPKALAFPDEVHEVEVIQSGAGLLIVPAGSVWDDFFTDGPHASPDFMEDRAQPPADDRDPL